MNDEKSTEQCSREPVISEDLNTPTDLQNKRSNYNILEDNITTLKTNDCNEKLYDAGNL